MAKPDFYLKQDDTSPALVATLVDEDQVAIDLTSATGVAFHMIDPGTTTPKVNGGSVTVLDAPNGRVSYAWQATDTDTAGDYDGEFEVTWTGGSKTTFPNFRFMRIRILKDISD